MIPLLCACGENLQVEELYAGGQVLCPKCGSPVAVPGNTRQDEKFRFHCPHCEVRVMARRGSAGKRSNCPSCGKQYVVPEPPPENEFTKRKESHPHRISLDTDDLAIRMALPFTVAPRSRPTSAPSPQARYMHTHDETDHVGATHAAVPIPGPPVPENPALPPAHWPPDTTTILPGDRPVQRPSINPHVTADPHVTAVIEVEHPPQKPPRPPLPKTAPEIAPVIEPGIEPGIEPVENLTVTALALPAVTVSPRPDVAIKPESSSEATNGSGELRVTGGNANGQRIRLDFHNFVVGAERDCHLRPGGPLISRHHCVFKKDEFALRVRDLGSKHGTFVNGRKISSEVVLNPGDAVKVGDLTLHVNLPHSAHVIQVMADSQPSLSDFVIL